MEKTSLFLEFIELQAEDKILEGKGDLYPKLENALQRGKDLYELSKASSFNLNFHLNANNLYNAITSAGCGCAFCLARHKYAKMKYILHVKKRTLDVSGTYYYENYDLKTYKRFQEEKEELESKIRKARKEMREIKRVLEILGHTCV